MKRRGSVIEEEEEEEEKKEEEEEEKDSTKSITKNNIKKIYKINTTNKPIKDLKDR